MIGDRIDRFARRIVRNETYRLVVAPAIADLQHEARLGSWSRVRAYAATWLTIGVAFAAEIAADVETTTRAGGVPSALGAMLLTIVCLSALQMIPIAFTLGTTLAWHQAAVLLALWLPAFIGPSLPAAIVPVSAMLAAGSPASRRAALIVATTVGVLMVALVGRLNPAAQALADELLRARAIASRDASLRNRPLLELRETFRTGYTNREARDVTARTVHREREKAGPLGLAVIACGMLGSAYRRKSRFALLALVAAALVLQILLVAAVHFLSVGIIYGSVVRLWTPPLLMLLTASLFALRASSARS
jgi:hypothetical protein